MRVRNADGELVPLQAVADVELVTAPASIIRYNNLRSVTINGGPAAGLFVRPGASRRWSSSPKRTLPAGYGYEWTGTALQEKAASGQTGFILGLALVFAYLFLVGLYESTDHSGRRAAVGRRSACSAPWRRCRSAASTTTSTPRSASWC